MRIFAVILMVFLMACSSKNSTLKIKGSDTEVNLSVRLAEQFRTENSKILVSVSGGGSGLGITSLLNGNTDIANSSRKMKSEELFLFQKDGVELDSFAFAQDAIAFIVSDKLALDSISIKSIAQILNGTISNWSILNQPEKPITIYGRQSNSGTYDYLKNILKIHFSPNAKQMNGNAQIIEAIKADHSGFGYVSVGYVLKGTTKGIKILSVFTERFKSVSPLDAAAISSGTYYFQRPLFQYFRKDEYLKIKPFLDFEKSEKGAKIIQESGYYPVMH